jgi:ribosomal protein S18 acetylase RimI-like enzyme
METGASSEATIAPVPTAERAEALRLCFAHLPETERQQHVETALEAIGAEGARPDGLLAARRGNRMVGAVLVQLQPGKTAIITMPRLAAGEPAATADRLLGSVCRRLADKGTCLAQVLLEKPTRDQDELLRKWLFSHLADLLYLVSLECEFPKQAPQSSLAFEPYSAANHARFAHVVEATYRETLDCPQLNGVRSIEDALAGYRAAGDFRRTWWLLASHEGSDVGCLLLADHPRHENVELLYMGVVPAARGRRFGIEITRHAQWLTRQADRRRLVLAVDADNAPAIGMYAAAGFQAWDRRTVYLRVFRRMG